MNRPSTVFVLVLSGREADALDFVQRRYPGSKTRLLSKTELRESSAKNRMRKLRLCRGEALVFFAESLQSVQEPTLLKWTAFVHRCRDTILADSSGKCEVVTKARLLCSLPEAVFVALLDFAILAFSWIALHVLRVFLDLRPEPAAKGKLLDVAFLFPSPSGLDAPGGALSHVTGFLSGLAREGASATVFSGHPFSAPCKVQAIPPARRLNLFREAAILSYNFRFAAVVRKLLAAEKPRLFYQRHGKFLFAGALLSRWMGVPLVLEYNGSEDWIARHWDPARFAPWLRLCERVALRAASLIVVVSNALKQQLMASGIPARRIVVNPNAVDPDWFHPLCGGAQLRSELGLRQRDVLVCFVGTFSYWHGVLVLGRAIRSLLDETPRARSLKFLFVGNGPLASQLRTELEPYAREGSVIFAGSIPHRAVRAYLDAADILVSPHVPMPGGTPFFGSPTKLFEYMAMGKAIAASALDQIAEVLEHGATALLVKPGDPADLASAVKRLASDAQLRETLGRSAREAAVARHTWRQNARRVLTASENSLFSNRDEAPLAVETPAPSSGLANQNP